MPDKLEPRQLYEITQQIKSDIDTWCLWKYDKGFRNHLGASIIGNPCHRYSWFNFRWASRKPTDGRQQRLFERGQREESRFNEWLEGVGFKIEPVDPISGKQWQVSAVGGHFSGSMDGKAYFPERYNLNYTKPFLLEYKTNGTGKGFDDLGERKSVAIAKPVHWDQQCVYGYLGDLDYSLYLNINKNDDSIYAELFEIDKKRGKDLVKKAEVIILSQEPPPRISEQPTAFECKYCDYKDICHFDKPLELNCRSCKFAEPRENRVWYCNKWDDEIPEDVIKTGCEQWTDIRK